MDLGLLCKVFFTSGAVVSIGGTLFPTFRENIMNYGSRKQNTKEILQQRKERTSLSRSLFDFVASLQVPHSWFIHYYTVSVISSLFWGYQIFGAGKVVEALTSSGEERPKSITANQIILAWSLMLLQGLRRLCESYTLVKASESKMWSGLWILGMLFYFFIGIAIWIEGARKYLVCPDLSPIHKLMLLAAIAHTDSLLLDVKVGVPSEKTAVAVALFVVASWVQNICHEHLSTLKKYSLPNHPFFLKITCPHYTCECLIYLAIATVSAPLGRPFNGTVLTGVLFVVTNLAVTADSTRAWYIETFGGADAGSRWRMIPLLY